MCIDGYRLLCGTKPGEVVDPITGGSLGKLFTVYNLFVVNNHYLHCVVKCLSIR